MPRTSHHGQGHSRGNGYDAWQSIIEKAKEAWEEWQKWLAAHSGSNGGNSSNGSGNGGSNSGNGGSQNNGNSGSNSGTGGGGASGHSSNDGSHSSGGGGGGDNGHDNHTSSSDHGNDGAAHNSTSTGSSSTASHGQSGSTSNTSPTSGNSTAIEPSDTAVLPSSPSGVPTSTLAEPNGTTLPQNSAVRKVNVAAIVAPVVLLTLLLLGVLAFILWRRRRAAHRQIRLESSSDVSHIPALPPPRPSPFATFSALATRLRGGASTTPTPVVPVMVQPPSTASRPVSLASTAPGAQFEVRHPFAAPLYPSTSAYSFGAGSSSWVAAHGHSDSQSGQMQFPHSSSSPSLPGHPGMYGHRYGASASGSIVGSGVFSLASAHHGHGPGLTPGNELTDPFSGPAPIRPYSVAGTEDSMRSDSQLGRRGEFIPNADAPPVPLKPVMSPLSPVTPGSAFPLLGTGHPVRTPGEESQLSYLGDTESGPEPEPEPEAVVHLARRISVGPASLINAPKPHRSSE